MTDEGWRRPVWAGRSFVSLILLVFAIVIWLLVGFEVIDPATTDPTAFEWVVFGFAAFGASFAV